MPFKGGLIAKALYLKEKHNFPIVDFSAIWAGINVITFFMSSILGLLGILLVYVKERLFNFPATLILFSAFITLLFIIIFSPEAKETKNRFINKFIRFLNGWHKVKSNAKAIFSIILITLSQFIVAIISSMTYYGVFGLELPFYKAMCILSFGHFSILVSITPAGLGINEAIAVFSGLIINIPPTQSLAVALLGRVITFAIILTLGPIFSYLLLKKG
jgi:uncharacterized protein (TIRG00374 family)